MKIIHLRSNLEFKCVYSFRIPLELLMKEFPELYLRSNIGNILEADVVLLNVAGE
jgi:hypothetical protein